MFKKLSHLGFINKFSKKNNIGWPSVYMYEPIYFIHFNMRHPVIGGGSIKNIYLDPIVNGVNMMNLETTKLF